MIQVEVTFIPPIKNASKEQIDAVAQTTFFQIEKTMLMKHMLIHILKISQNLLLSNETYCQSVFPLIEGFNNTKSLQSHSPSSSQSSSSSSSSNSFADPSAFWALSYETGQVNTSYLASPYINLPYSIMVSNYFPNLCFFSHELEHVAQHINVFDYYFTNTNGDNFSSKIPTLKFYLQCKLPSCENCSSEISVRTPFRIFDFTERKIGETFEITTKEEKNKNNLDMQIYDINQIEFVNFERKMFSPIHRCLLGHVLCSSCYFMLMQSQLDFFCPICDQQLHQVVDL